MAVNFDSDTISRQAAIDEIKEIYEWHDNVTKERIIEHFKQLPPVQPERIKGHWIKISPANIYECSECGKNVMTNDICAYDFCHGCGAKMESEVQNEID